MPRFRSRYSLPTKARSIEQLESRYAPAVDLAIAVDSFTIEEVGEEVTRVVHVYNNGDQDVDDALVQVELSDQLQDAKWTRTAGYAQYLHRTPTKHTSGNNSIDGRTDPRSAKPFGDLDGDGFTDYFYWSGETTTIAFGVEGMDGKQPISESDVRKMELATASLPFRTYALSPLGDANQDGHRDFGFDMRILLGGPANSPLSGEPLSWIRVDPGLEAGYPGTSYAIDAGDVNGDGVDDIAWRMFGPDTTLTQTTKALTEAISGASLIFGRRDLGAEEVVDARIDGAVIAIQTPYFSRPSVHTEDVNADGVNDVILRRLIRSERTVIFGGSQLRSIDLGINPKEVLDGVIGFNSRGRRIELNELFAQTMPPAVGSGDVVELVSIPVGTSLTYEIQGEVKADASTSLAASVWPHDPSSEEQLSDNAFVATRAIDVIANLEHPQLVAGERTTFNVTIENVGPHHASVEEVVETLSSSLVDPVWTLTTESLFLDQMDHWDARVGPQQLGLTRLPFCERCDSLIFRDLTALGIRSGRLGDINGDGFDDFYLGMTSRARKSGNSIRIFFGAGGLDESGHFEDVSPSVIISSGSRDSDIFGASPLGDIDGDGFDDFAVEMTQGRERTVYGRADFATLGELVELRELRTTSVDYPAGDINGDGLLDLLDGKELVLGGEPGQRIPIDSVNDSLRMFRLGDVNGDGFDDLGVLSWKSGEWEAIARLLLGRGDPPSRWDADSAYTFDATGLLRNWAFAPGSDHDFNGDGFADVVLLSRCHEEVHVAFGASDLSEKLPVAKIATGRSCEGFVGNPIAVGDINGDGFDDLIVAGFATTRVFFGGPLFAQEPSIVIRGHFNEFPMTVASGFDVNDDGVEDLLIGDPSHPPPGEVYDAGRAFLLLGRRATNLSGRGTFDQSFGVRPLEQLVLSITGTVTEATLAERRQVSLVPAPNQHELNPLNNVAYTQASQDPADLDGNGRVDFDDFLVLAGNFGKSDASRAEGDLTGDQVVSFIDFVAFAAAFKEHLEE